MKRLSRLIAFCLLSFTLYSCGSVAFTGRKQFLMYSDSEITSLSEQSYTEFMSTASISSNASNSKMVKEVGQKMTQALENYLKTVGQTDYLEGLKWDYQLVKSEEVNAFCLPSGKIVFYEGIMPLTNTKDFIAVVMGHEIAHAVARHGNERMSQEALVGTVGNTIMGLMSQNVSTGTQALFNIAYSIGGQYGVILPYSRKHEYEADKIGLIIMAMAGYDVDQAPIFWEKMSASNTTPVPEFMSTHPSDKNRIAKLRESLAEAKTYINK